MRDTDETRHKVEATHSIDLVTGLKLVSIFWAGTMPIVIPAWLIIKAEITEQNRAQDEKVATRYVTREELAAAKLDFNRRLEAIEKHLEVISKNQQKVLIKLKVDP